jgi:hypothetical protein
MNEKSNLSYITGHCREMSISGRYMNILRKICKNVNLMIRLSLNKMWEMLITD